MVVVEGILSIEKGLFWFKDSLSEFEDEVVVFLSSLTRVKNIGAFLP